MKKTILIGLTLVILVGIGIGVYRGKAQTASDEEIVVKRGEITQQVNATGQIKPAQSVDLTFERAGKVQAAYVNVGDSVQAGQLLVSIDNSDLQAQLAQTQASVQSAKAGLLQAQAGLANQQAKLDELKAGTRPEEIQVAQASVESAESTLQNAQTNLANVKTKAASDTANGYDSAANTLSDAYAKGDDAINRQTDELFNNDTGPNPQLTFVTSNVQAQTDAQWGRFVSGQNLVTFQQEVATLNASEPAIEQELVKAQNYLSSFLLFFNHLNNALNAQASLSPTTLATYRANITTARTNLNAGLSAISSAKQAITSQAIANSNAISLAQTTVDNAKNSLDSAQSQLNLKQAGPTLQSITAQAALVSQAQGSVAAQAAAIMQAQANVANVQAQIAKTMLRSPLAGIVTKQDAKVGQLALVNTALVSIISPHSLQIEAHIPEADIGKVNFGNPVHITLDALVGQTFTGKLIHIDPAQTVVDGVINFKILVAFDQEDARFKSGLTANLGIETLKKDNVLLLPQIALLENDKGTFVKEKQGNAINELPVTIGIRGENGNLEILSGVKEGEKVLNIGRKVAQ